MTRRLVEDVLDNQPPPLTCRHVLAALCLVASPREIKERAKMATSAIAEEASGVYGLFGALRHV